MNERRESELSRTEMTVSANVFDYPESFLRAERKATAGNRRLQFLKLSKAFAN
jgi:hypothetical protein